MTAKWMPCLAYLICIVLVGSTLCIPVHSTKVVGGEKEGAADPDYTAQKSAGNVPKSLKTANQAASGEEADHTTGSSFESSEENARRNILQAKRRLLAPPLSPPRRSPAPGSSTSKGGRRGSSLRPKSRPPPVPKIVPTPPSPRSAQASQLQPAAKAPPRHPKSPPASPPPSPPTTPPPSQPPPPPPQPKQSSTPPPPATDRSGIDPIRPRPNFVIIMTDDQDQLMNSTHPSYMPNLDALISAEGMHLRNFLISTSTCCPSRLNLLTGFYTHNHNVTSNILPYGSFGRFASTKLDDEWMPTRLQTAGYNTMFVGKFVNGFYGAKSNRCPKGFSIQDTLVEPFVYSFYGPAFSYNCGEPVQLDGSAYNTDVISDKAAKYIKQAAAGGAPFWLQLNPIAPHTQCVGEAGADKACTFPVPAARHRNLFVNATLPRGPNYGVPFFPELSGQITPWNKESSEGMTNDARNARHYVARQQSLAAVDDLIGTVVQALDEAGVLDNTYIIYMSDNGYHLGQHDLGQGKMLPVEEDVRVPFYIRGPGIPRGIVSDYQATVVDVPATIITLAGMDLPPSFDGIPIPFTVLNAAFPQAYKLPTYSVPGTRPSVLTGGRPYMREGPTVEMWLHYPGSALNNNIYRSVRLCTSHLAFGDTKMYQAAYTNPPPNSLGSTLGAGNLFWTSALRTSGGGTFGVGSGAGQGVLGTCYKYTIWCFGTHELYDLGLDPYELNNRYRDPAAVRMIQRLDALLSMDSYCKGMRCSLPYSYLFPDGSIQSFEDAMLPQYDAAFAKLPKFGFFRCMNRYLTSNELSFYKGIE